MSEAKRTFDVYTQIGVLVGCVSIATRQNAATGRWELWGHFATADGRRNGKVAEFDAADDAIEFLALAGF